MADFLDEKKREIDARLKELRPLVDEFHRLEAAAAALDGVAGGGVAQAKIDATVNELKEERDAVQQLGLV